MLTTVLNGKKLNLIQNVEELRWLRKEIENSKTVGVDCETTGLSFIKDRMVGLCITACRPMQGFYLPVRHVIGNNLPLDEVVEIAQYAISNKKTMFFNRNYDTTMLELDGCYIPYNADMHDVQVMCWEATNEKFPALKKFAKNYLKWKVIDFGETAGTDEDGNANHNFGETDPEQSYIYAAMDPIMTVELGRYMWNTYPYIRKIYPVDNLVTEAVRRMGKVDVQIDYKRLGELSEEANKELRSLRQQIIQMVGYEFNIGSNRQKAEALSRFVTLSVKTKGGDFSVKDEVLQEIDHPLAGLLLDFSKKSKFNNSFIKPLSLMEGKPVHFNFKTVEVPTGRMAAGQVRGNDYFARLNVQALPKKKVHRFLHEGSDLGYYLDDNPEGSLGDQEVKAGFRDCFKAPDGYVFVSADFCGEEINICANLSGDDTWCNAINDGKDIHMESAKKVFGIADKEKRGIVKTCSFLIIYGGGEFTLSKRLKVPLQEAKNMFNAFHVGMPKVTRWIKYTIDQARRKGILFTYYGRPRLLFQYYSSPDPKKHSFADRSAVNTLCQGCIPTNLHIELKNKAVYFASHLGSKFTLADGREAITSGRRTGLCYLILTKSGDFAIADENHGFVHGSKKKPLYRRVCEGLNVKIRTSKLQSKMFPNIFELKNLFTASGRKKVKSTLMALTMKDEVVKNRRISTYFFICWLLKLPLNFKDIHRAASMRSIASVFGFNLKMDVSSDIQCLEKADYYLHWFRKSKTTVVGVRKLDVENIGSMTLTSGYQIYPTQGFLNKNTGADIMRILLCKFFQRKNDDSEFNANVELGWHVHDEINVYVKKEYLFKFFYILRDLMWVRNSNWRTDLKSDIGIGTNWGNGINAIGVTPEGTLIIKGLNDTPEVMERTRIAVKEAGLKWDDDLGLKRI